VLFDVVSTDNCLYSNEVDSVTVSDQPFIKEILSQFGKLLLSFCILFSINSRLQYISIILSLMIVFLTILSFVRK